MTGARFAPSLCPPCSLLTLRRGAWPPVQTEGFDYYVDDLRSYSDLQSNPLAQCLMVPEGCTTPNYYTNGLPAMSLPDSNTSLPQLYMGYGYTSPVRPSGRFLITESRGGSHGTCTQEASMMHVHKTSANMLHKCIQICCTFDSTPFPPLSCPPPFPTPCMHPLTFPLVPRRRSATRGTA